MIEADATAVPVLARDLAEGIGGRALRITASGDVAREAAGYWRKVLAPTGLVVLGPGEPDSAESARIHLHGEVGAPTSYSATGLALEELSHDLVGEVVGRGATAADRYSSLIAVGDAVADAVVDLLAERT
jgi:hypothetical protein